MKALLVSWVTSLRSVFLVLGASSMAIVFQRGWMDLGGAALPGTLATAGAALLVLLGLFSAGRGWVTLLGVGTSEARSLAGFYQSQVGKYLPGGIWQPIGQVTFLAEDRRALSDRLTALPIHVVTQLVAGAVIGSSLALFGTHLPPILRAFALMGAASVFLLDRRWMTVAAGKIASLRGAAFDEDAIPGQGAIVRSFGWSCVTILLSGLAFGLLLTSGGYIFQWTAVPTFALAWAVGFVVFPVPSGLGIREGMLVVLLSTGAAAVLVAALLHRVVTIAAEVVMIGIIGLRWK